MSCDFAHLDGSYVLGALSTTERRDYEQHLESCPSCARAVQELAGLPGLLARVDPVVLEGPPEEEEELPDTLLPALVREVRRSRRRRMLAAGSLAAAAAAVAVTLGTVAVTSSGDGDAPTAAPPPTTSAPVGRPMTSLGYAGMQADVALTSVPWGTRLDLTCSYADSHQGWEPAAGTTYALVVRTSDGRTQQVATWHALPGRTMHLTAGTSAGAGQISSVEVRSSQGQPLLRLDT